MDSNGRAQQLLRKLNLSGSFQKKGRSKDAAFRR
jgi:hypothetical protein